MYTLQAEWPKELRFAVYKMHGTQDMVFINLKMVIYTVTWIKIFKIFAQKSQLFDKIFAE